MSEESDEVALVQLHALDVALDVALDRGISERQREGALGSGLVQLPHDAHEGAHELCLQLGALLLKNAGLFLEI